MIFSFHLTSEESEVTSFLSFYFWGQVVESADDRCSHQRCSIKKVFLKILQNSQESTCAGVFSLIRSQVSVCIFIKGEALLQVFSCEFWLIFKNISFTEHLRTTASVIRVFLINLWRLTRLWHFLKCALVIVKSIWKIASYVSFMFKIRTTMKSANEKNLYYNSWFLCDYRT